MSYKYDIGTEPGQVAESPTFGVRFQALEHVWTLYFFAVWLANKTNFRTAFVKFRLLAGNFHKGQISEFFGSKKLKNLGKSASGGQSLTDRGFRRYVSCSLNIQEQFETKKFSIPRGLIGRNCDLRKAIFPIFKRLCLPDKAEFDRFPDTYELVWVFSIYWTNKTTNQLFCQAIWAPLSMTLAYYLFL